MAALCRSDGPTTSPLREADHTDGDSRDAAPRLARGCDSGGVTSLHPSPVATDEPDPTAGAPLRVLPGADLLEALLTDTDPEHDPVTHVHRLPARASRVAPWPAWVAPELR